MANDLVDYVTIVEPLSPEEMERELTAALERQAEGGEDADNVAAGRQVSENHTIKIALTRATRAKAFDRADARDDVQKWMVERLGLKSVQELVDIEFSTLDRETLILFNCMWQATDILGALLPDKCENWSPPATIDGWAELPDYIFAPILQRTYQLNPHWGAEAGISLGNLRPGSRRSGKTGTND